MIIYHADEKHVTVTTMDGQLAKGDVVGVYSSLEEWGRDILRRAQLFHPELFDEPFQRELEIAQIQSKRGE